MGEGADRYDRPRDPSDLTTDELRRWIEGDLEVEFQDDEEAEGAVGTLSTEELRAVAEGGPAAKSAIDAEFEPGITTADELRAAIEYGRTPGAVDAGQRANDARQILDARYARGELTREQYQGMRRDLGG